MSKTTIYHNPRCSKSRATLEILEQQPTQVTVIKYLDSRLSVVQIQQLLLKLDVGVRDILRKSEAAYKEQGFDDQSLTEAELIGKLSQFPKVMQRPIVTHGGKAIIGRPPENVLSLFK